MLRNFDITLGRCSSVGVEINVTRRLTVVLEVRRRLNHELINDGAAGADCNDLGCGRGTLQQLVYLVIVLRVAGEMLRNYDAFLYPELNTDVIRMKKLQRIIDAQDNKIPH